MRKLMVLTSILCLLILPAIMAHNTESTETQSNVETIKLETDGNSISWETEGYSAKGFKVVWSKNKNPTYPPREGDKYHYYSNPNKNTDTLTSFNGEGIYYVRVCEYLGEKCGIYSNQIELRIEENEQTTEKELKEKEPIEEIPEENTSTEQTIECNGCLLNNICYPLGHRINGTFCSNNFNLTNQLTEDSPCENNFECQSNVCVSGKCISTGFIRKIISWFKNFF